jgi:hypothetical protein
MKLKINEPPLDQHDMQIKENHLVTCNQFQLTDASIKLLATLVTYNWHAHYFLSIEKKRIEQHTKY